MSGITYLFGSQFPENLIFGRICLINRTYMWWSGARWWPAFPRFYLTSLVPQSGLLIQGSPGHSSLAADWMYACIANGMRVTFLKGRTDWRGCHYIYNFQAPTSINGCPYKPQREWCASSSLLILRCTPQDGPLRESNLRTFCFIFVQCGEQPLAASPPLLIQQHKLLLRG